MPPLADMLGPHAEAHARAGLVARGRRRQKLLTGYIVFELRDGDERRKDHGADVQHARAVHVVELEALNLRAVGERGVRSGKPLACAPYAASFRVIET